MKFYIFILMLFLSAVLFAEDHALHEQSLGGDWVVTISNLENETVTSMKIRFTNDKADSCLGGNWHKVDVVSHTTIDESFFPVNGALSYDYSEEKIVIGRNEICDAYLHLDGSFKNMSANGEYISFGWGSKKIGHFFLSRDTVNGS